MISSAHDNDHRLLDPGRTRGDVCSRRWRAAAVVVAVVALVLAAAPAPAAADHTRRDVKVESAALYYTTKKWTKGSGGDTGRNGFWRQTVGSSGSSGAYAKWPMGDLRGDYKLKVFVPRDGASPAPKARAIYRVEEYRDGKWVTVKRIWVDQSSQRGWRRSVSAFTLNGPVRVVARVNDASTEGRSTAVLAVHTAKLEWQMPHPVDRDIEADYCASRFEDKKPAPGQVASAVSAAAAVRPMLPRIPNVFPGQTNWQKCQRLRDGETIWIKLTLVSVPWRPGSGLTDDHDSQGRAVPGRSWTRW